MIRFDTQTLRFANAVGRPELFVGIDPGTRETGWAFIDDDGRLLQCGVILAGGLEQMLSIVDACLRKYALFAATAVAIERPQLYGVHDRSDPNKIGQLLLVAGRASAAFPGTRLRLPYPAMWKGQVPKHVHHTRVLRRLDPISEFRLSSDLKSVAPGKRHNVLDALGLALWVKDECDERRVTEGA